MMKDSIHYYDSKCMNRYMGFGQMLTLAFACHMKTKELGFKHTICEWHHKVAYLWDNYGNCKGVIKKPTDWKWDIKFVDKGTQMRNIKSIDLSEENSLFDGCSAIMNKSYTMIPTFEYLNKYASDTGSYPMINVYKDSVQKYVLFHYRESEQDRQLYRNTPIEKFKEIFNKMKKKYEDSVEYKKFGEPSQIDNEFDEVVDYKSDNITELFDLVNNATEYIGSPTGTLTLAYMFGVPVTLLLDSETKLHYTDRNELLRYGNTIYDWLDKSKVEFVYV